MTAAERKPLRHGDHPCVIDVLMEYMSEREAFALAWEFTCFPFDCREAVEQARQLIADAGWERRTQP